MTAAPLRESEIRRYLAVSPRRLHQVPARAPSVLRHGQPGAGRRTRGPEDEINRLYEELAQLARARDTAEGERAYQAALDRLREQQRAEASRIDWLLRRRFQPIDDLLSAVGDEADPT